MIKKISLLLALSYSCFAQLIVLNETNRKSIDGVEVYSDKGVLLCLSNSKGEIPLQPSQETLQFSHFLYHLKTSRAAQVVYLTPRSIELADVQVKSNKRKMGIVLKGYFRSFQFRNDSLEFFSDGEIEVLVSANPNKGNQYKRTQERNLTGQLFKIAYSGKTMQYGMTIASPPILELIRTKDLQASALTFNPRQDSIVLFQPKTGKNWGHINRINANLVQVNIHQYPPGEPNILKGLGMESHILVNDEESIAHVQNVENLDPIQLIYHKNVKKLDFKAKGRPTYDHYYAIAEFFVTSAEVESGEEKGFSKRTSLGMGNHYSNRYWEKAASHPNFKPLPSSIEEEINRQSNQKEVP